MKVALLLAATCVAGAASTAWATTIAYYRFEEGPDGGFLTAAGGGPTSSFSVDSTGNAANALRTFNSPATVDRPFDTSPRYSVEVPAGTVPLSGAANAFSFRFDGSDDIYLNDPAASPLTTTFDTGTTFTIEAFVRTFAVDQFRTFVGRDNSSSFSQPQGLFYLQQRGAGLNRFAVSARQKDGTFADVNATDTLNPNQWYHLAAVANGTSLELFVDGVSQGTVPFTGLYDAPTTEMWTIGRGWFNGPNDFADANIDEVRFSDTALTPSQFLNVPEPGTLGLLVGAGLLALRRRA
jgi:hypothetical protein